MLKKAESELSSAEYQSSEKSGLILNLDNSSTRRFVESCYRTTSTMLNPIVDWSDADVYSFLRHYGCAMNPLYSCGHNRIGCIGCPMQSHSGMRADFAHYPAYRNAYIRAFDKMLANMNAKTTWQTGIDVYNWWVGIDSNQLSFFDDDC